MPEKTATKEKPSERPVKFTPPKVVHQQIVVWYPLGRRELGPAMSVAQAVGQRSLDLAVLRPTDRFFTQMYGVRHIDDPDVSHEIRETDGGWDLAPPNIVNAAPRGYIELADRVEVLERRLARLVEKTADKKEG
jgi:hypothetical protein